MYNFFGGKDKFSANLTVCVIPLQMFRQKPLKQGVQVGKRLLFFLFKWHSELEMYWIYMKKIHKYTWNTLYSLYLYLLPYF